MDMGEGWQRWDGPQPPEYCAVCGTDVTDKDVMDYAKPKEDATLLLVCDECVGWSVRAQAVADQDA